MRPAFSFYDFDGLIQRTSLTEYSTERTQSQVGTNWLPSSLVSTPAYPPNGQCNVPATTSIHIIMPVVFSSPKILNRALRNLNSTAPFRYLTNCCPHCLGGSTSVFITTPLRQSSWVLSNLQPGAHSNAPSLPHSLLPVSWKILHASANSGKGVLPFQNQAQQ